MIEPPPYSPHLVMNDFWVFLNLNKDLRYRRSHSRNETDMTTKVNFYRFKEMDDLKHLTFGNFSSKSALVEIVLNITTKI